MKNQQDYITNKKVTHVARFFWLSKKVMRKLDDTVKRFKKAGILNMTKTLIVEEGIIEMCKEYEHKLIRAESGTLNAKKRKNIV